MRKSCLLWSGLLACAGLAHAAQTTISGTLYLPTGAPATCTITVVGPSAPAVDSSGNVLRPAVMAFHVTAGAYSFTLNANDSLTPSGTSYAVSYSPACGAATETWVVPTSATAVNIGQVRSSTIPVPSSLLQYTQISGLSLGDFLYGSSLGVAARLAKPADGTYGITFTGGVPAWSAGGGGTGCIPGGTSGALQENNGTGGCTASSVRDDGTSVSVASNFTIVEASGIPSKIAGVTTVGLGTPVVGWKSNVTNQPGSQATVTLATTPGAGDYEIHYNADLNTPCTTGSDSVTFTWNWTDASNARALTTGALILGAAQATNSFLSGIVPIHVGSGNVTYSSTVTGSCTTGSSSYDINVWMVRAL